MQALDLTGPYEVFNAANRVVDAQGISGIRYDLRVVGDLAAIATESGLRLAAEPLPAGETPHTLVLPGGDGVHDCAADPVVLSWIGQVGNNVERLATVCTGTFLAAAAGLLDDRRVTTHWASTDRLASEYPDLDVDADAIYCRDGPVWSSAGVTAGIDLALALVEDDMGPGVAQTVARYLVVFLRRPGGQSQFSAPVWSKPAEAEPIRRAQDLIHADPADDLSVGTLAASVGLSTRHFARLFSSQTESSPARYVESVRLTAARTQLETTNSGVAAVARHCGFGTAETLRRVFLRRLGVAPDHYRRRFRIGTADAPRHPNQANQANPTTHPQET